MSGRLIADVLADIPDGATRADRLVATLIAFYANDATRECWPGMERLARNAGMHPEAVRRCLSHLAALGYDVRRSGAHRGARTTYRVPDPKPQRGVGPFDDPKPQRGVGPFDGESPNARSRKTQRSVGHSPNAALGPSFHEPTDKQPRGDADASPWMNDFLNGINQPRGRLPRIKPVGRIPELCARIQAAGWTPGRAAKYVASESGIDIAKADTRTGLIVDKITEAAGIAEADQTEQSREQRRRDFAVNYAGGLPADDVDPEVVAKAKAVIADQLAAQRDARAAAKAEREQSRLARQAAEQAERERVAAAFTETGVDLAAAQPPLPDPDGDPNLETLPPGELQRALDRPPPDDEEVDDDQRDGAA